MKRSRPTRFSALLEQTLSRFGLDRRLDDYRVWQAWDEVVGRTISRNAQPVRLDGTRLVVAVKSSTWLHELSLLQREIIVRLNEWMQREVVRELFFVVGRVEAQERPTGRPGAQGLRPPRGRDGDPEALHVAGPPDAAELEPDVAATFERLWKAARSRGPGATTKDRR